jgi:hypothetical protein
VEPLLKELIPVAEKTIEDPSTWRKIFSMLKAADAMGLHIWAIAAAFYYAMFH